MVLKDLEEYCNNHNETLISEYPDKNYINADTYILSICEYEKEGDGCLNRYFDYEINFNDKTYKKVN